MNILVDVAKVALGGFLLFNAFNHVYTRQALAQYAYYKGVPYPSVAVIVAGLLLAVAGLATIFGFVPWVGVAAITLFFVPVGYYMHGFWSEQDEQARSMDLIQFTKNIAIWAGVVIALLS